MIELAAPRVVAIAGDPGGAEAVAPVILALARRGIEIASFGYKQAQAIWASKGIRVIPADESWTDEDAARCIEQERAEVVLAGTSRNEANLEVRFLRAARRLGVPTLAVLDFWSNYSARFDAVAGHGDAVPERVAVMDARARDEMLAEGFDPAVPVVTGHPGFDDLVEFASGFDPERRSLIRRSMGFTSVGPLVMFASQPLAAMWGSSTSAPGHLGYTEQTALAQLLPVLERVLARRRLESTLVVRPHPREECEPSVPSTTLAVRVSRAGRPREAMLAADVVIGMCSMMLLENALLGRPTLSFQPGLRIANLLPMPAHAAARTVTRLEHLEDALEQVLTLSPAETTDTISGAVRLSPLLTGGASERVAALALSLVRRRAW